MVKKYEPITPGKKWGKELYVKTMFVILGRSLEVAAKIEPTIKKELSVLKDGFTLVMKVLPKGPSLSMEMVNGKFKYRGAGLNDGDIVFYIKNIESALMITTPQLTLAKAFAEKRMTVKGDITIAIIIKRCFEVLLGYFLWDFWVEKVSAYV